jgi:hypothetical protein
MALTKSAILQYIRQAFPEGATLVGDPQSKAADFLLSIVKDMDDRIVQLERIVFALQQQVTAFSQLISVTITPPPPPAGGSTGGTTGGGTVGGGTPADGGTTTPTLPPPSNPPPPVFFPPEPTGSSGTPTPTPTGSTGGSGGMSGAGGGGIVPVIPIFIDPGGIGIVR